MDENKYNVSLSLTPASAAELAAKANGAVTVHFVANAIREGDAPGLLEHKATYHRLTAETAKPIYEALGSLVSNKPLVLIKDVEELWKKLLGTLAGLSHPLGK